MDAHRFDSLVRDLSKTYWRRRRLSHVFATGTVAIMLGSDALQADAGKKRKKKHKKKKAPVCVPNCAGKNCGQSDGCSGFCTASPGGKLFQKGQCVAPTCVPNCTGKGCGDPDGCGATCTACPSGKSCQAGVCVGGGCTPNCATKSCGDPDGCGGRCATPQGCNGWQCDNFRCCVAEAGCNGANQGAPCCGVYGRTCGVVGSEPGGDPVFGCQSCLGCCVAEDACEPGLIGIGCCGSMERCWTVDNVTYECMSSGIG